MVSTRRGEVQTGRSRSRGPSKALKTESTKKKPRVRSVKASKSSKKQLPRPKLQKQGSSIVDFGSETNLSVGMTPLQEHLNAISMLFPLMALCHDYFVKEGHALPSSIQEILGSAPLLVIASTALHCPFSVIYHFRQGMKLDEDRINNRWRCMDQSAIHFVCSIYSYALSGWKAYALVLLPLNAYAAWCLWSGGQNSFGKPVQMRLQPAIQLYLLPILLRGGMANYVKGLGFGFLCFLCFMTSKYIKGWGHVIFHIIATPYSMVLLEASKSVQL